MKTVFASAIAGLLLYGAIAHGETPPEQMQFRALPPTNADAIRGGNAWMIAADGVIDAGAANRLQGLLDLHRIPGHSVLAINSPGGSVLAAMELGKIIRKFDLYTSVGIARTTCGKPQSGFALCFNETSPGYCYSACTLSFLGGSFRYPIGNSVYGVHRFYWDKSIENGSDMAQMLSAVVVQYIRDMGADPQLFSEMTVKGRDDILAIPEPELERLNVVNWAGGKPVWTIEEYGFGFYLKGQRDTPRGTNKIIIGCTQPVALFAIFDAQGHGDEILQTRAYSLAIDQQYIPLQPADTPKLNGGWINVMFTLTPALLSRIERAHTLGVIVQFIYGAPTFIAGFDDMDFSGGAQKLAGLFSSCKPVILSNGLPSGR